MADVTFQDFALDVEAKLDETAIAWLHTWASEIESHAKRNCSRGESYSNQLRGSYRNVVDEKNGEATIGTPMEQGYWEEFGTGSYADTTKNGGREGRKGWWIYKEGYVGNGGKTYTEKQAKAIQKASGGEYVATNGRKPNYTLENAFLKNKARAIQDLQEQLKGMGE